LQNHLPGQLFPAPALVRENLPDGHRIAAELPIFSGTSYV
jgi:hypothetical protein